MNKNEYILSFMRMERKKVKEITRMGKKMDYGLGGMRMERKGLKELLRMGN